jgi:hypothetical protein
MVKEHTKTEMWARLDHRQISARFGRFLYLETDGQMPVQSK